VASLAASQALTDQFFERPLGSLPRREPVAVGPGARLGEGLRLMQTHGTGSVLLLDADGRPRGILTRHDLLPRVALAHPPLDIDATPIADVATQPVHTLDVGQPVQAAALLMARLGIRHVPLTEQGRVVGLVSERDLFSLHQRSIRQLGAALRAAPSAQALVALAPGIRRFAADLHAQGVGAKALTDLVSHLNDTLTARLFDRLCQARGLVPGRAAWVTFGSEGRAEQTVATDQDNGLVLDDRVDDVEREEWLALGREANALLDACGFPLCKGGVMAGNPDCCLRQREWVARFRRWIAHGEPEDLLSASIFFDLRAVGGSAELAAPLHQCIAAEAPKSSRFLRLLAENSLRLRPALSWWGGLDTQAEGEQRWIDLKLHGTAVFVDGARLMALAQGVEASGTRSRLEEAGSRLGVGESERRAWVGAFDELQLLRLRIQLALPSGPEGPSPNRLDVRTLHDLDLKVLKEAMRAAQGLQERIRLEWLNR
jgi:CBS domain-containing protein